MSLEIVNTWINSNLTGDPYMKCDEWTKIVLERFPELIRVRGHYCCPYADKRPHWWLKTKDGITIDPTKRQFDDNGMFGEYEEWDESQPEPKGICMECGEISFWNQNICSKECEIRFINC